jgi:DNA-binding protein
MKENIVYVGRKPVMNYCNAVLQVISEHDTVKLVARGRAITNEVNVAEVTRNRFLRDLKVESVEIGTEELKSGTEEAKKVSSIAITLRK